MECGEECVTVGIIFITRITILPEFCAGNWDTMSTQVEVSWFKICDVARRKFILYGSRNLKSQRKVMEYNRVWFHYYIATTKFKNLFLSR